MEARTIEATTSLETAREKTEKVSVVLLFLLSMGAYLNTLGNAFVYDDDLQILQNPYIKSWHYLPEIFRTTVWSFVGAAGESNYYRPLMTLTYLGLWKIFGNLPIGFHLFNVVLNAFVVICVYYAGRNLLKDDWAAILAAVLFAVHPVHTETVAWIAAVPDLEATLFFLIGFDLYMNGPGPGWKTQALIVACLLLALLAKEPALMFVPVLIFYEHFVRDGRNETPFLVKVKRYLPACVAGAAYVLWRIVLFGKLAPVLQHAQISWPQAIYSGFALVSAYCRYLFWPTHLSAFHVFHASQSFVEARVLLGAGIVAASAIFALLMYKRSPVTTFCVVWIGIALLPVLNARWMAANVFTERYLYLPSVGFCWLIGLAIKTAWDRLKEPTALRGPLRAVLCGLLVALVLLGATRTWTRNRVWHDDMTLYRKTIETDPDSYVMHMNMGVGYFEIKDFSAAERELLRALELKPDSANALNALGCVYLEEGRLDDGAKAFQTAIRLKPLWTDSHFNYGRLLKAAGQKDQALAEFQTAVRVGPVNASAALFLAQELAERGDDQGAEAEYRRSIALAPSLIARSELADLLLRTGRANLAEPILHEMANDFPFDGATHLRLGQIMERAGRTDEARREYQAILALDPANAEAQDALKRLQSASK